MRWTLMIAISLALAGCGDEPSQQSEAREKPQRPAETPVIRPPATRPAPVVRERSESSVTIKGDVSGTVEQTVNGEGVRLHIRDGEVVERERIK